jgi:pimeloyl-ACP methyl ester carboxylesterase
VARSTAVVSVGAVSAVAVLVGATGMATGGITDSLMMSSSAASAFRGGGAGAIRTDITVTTLTRMITMAMDTAGTHTAMDTAGTHTATTMGTADTVTTVVAVTDSAMAADQGISKVRGVGDKPSYGSLKIRDEATCESSKSGRPMFGDSLVTTAAWRSKPSWMLVATKDRTINPDLERWYAERARSHKVEVSGASHSVYVSRPKEVAALIEEAASHAR